MINSMKSSKKIEAEVKNDNKIFISWSGQNTKCFAITLKNIIETVIFPDTGLKCFVSDVDIDAGTDWWSRIKDELESCGLGILCVTNENVNAPWIFYEAGGMASRDIPSVPLLINCKINSLVDTPLQGKQCVSFDNQEKFVKMVENINKRFNLLPNTVAHSMAKVGYDKLKNDTENTIKCLENIHVISTKDLFPQEVIYAKPKTVYISVPMASITEEEYIQIHKYLLKLQLILKDIGFVGVYSSALTIEGRDSFDGGTKAINDNFATLKEVDSILVIYPRQSPSSTLMDIGYGIALCKKMVIFYGEDLPYMLEEAGQHIKHVKTYSYKKLDEIGRKIKSNGMDIFGGNYSE